jgi:hypothetical protein
VSITEAFRPTAFGICSSGTSSARKTRRGGHREHRPHRRIAGEHNDGEERRHRRADRVDREQEPVPIDAVTQQPHQRCEDEQRAELCDGDQAERHARIRDVQHQQSRGDGLHHVAALREPLADEEPAQVR